MKKLAVVILNWNGAKLLRHYLPTVVATTLSDENDVIVADNASTDESIQLLETEFPEVQIIKLDKNYGFAGGYNRAIKQLKHEYVLLLNSDVATTPNWTHPLIDLLDNNQNIAICAPKILDDNRHTHFEYAGAAGGYLDYLGYPFCRGRIMDCIEPDNGQYDNNADTLWVSGAALMIRRQVYEAFGGLDEDFFAHMEEIDLCWRIRNTTARVVACGESKVYHLGGATLSSSNPRKTYLNFRNNLVMYVKNSNTHLWPFWLFLRLLLDGIAGIMFIVKGQWSFCYAIIKAHWAFFGSIGKTIKKRRALSPKRSNTAPPEIKPYSMIFKYHILKQKYFSENY